MRILQNRLFFCIFTIISLIILLGVGLLLAGCPNNSRYKAVKVTKSGIRFSFEYSALYSDYASSLINDDDMVVLFHYLPDTTPQMADKHLRIETWITDSKFPNAAALLEAFLKEIPNVSEGFKLIERSPIEVSGIKGELIIFTGRTEVVDLNTDNVKGWEVYLDYKGQIVTLLVISNIIKADEAKVDFDHLVQSFKFLN